MSILIKGMEMPKRCEDCKLRYRDHLAMIVKDKCYLMGMKNVDPYTFGGKDRPDWCPLVEIPPHGRLIDADVLPEISLFGTTEYINVRNAPTIIEAEETE